MSERKSNLLVPVTFPLDFQTLKLHGQ